MILLCHNIFAGRTNALSLKRDSIRVGRGNHNHLVLDNPLIGEDALTISRIDSGWQATAHGTNGCRIGGRTLQNGDSALVLPSQKIELFPFEIQIEEDESKSTRIDYASLRTCDEMVHRIHHALLELLKHRGHSAVQNPKPDELIQIEHEIEHLAKTHLIDDPSQRETVLALASVCLRDVITHEITNDVPTTSILQQSTDWRRMVTQVAQFEDAIVDLAESIMDELRLDSIEDPSLRIEAFQAAFDVCWSQRQSELLWNVATYMACQTLKKQVKDLVYGYGPLEELLRNPSISEVMVVDSNHIFIEKNGIVENSGRRFLSDDVTLTVIDRIVSRVGRRIDKSQPLVDARLLDGSRVNAVIPPLAVSGPSITIRKFPSKRLQMSDLVAMSAMTPAVADFLRACVVAKRNIVIAGGTGTGKTTLLNCLADCIPPKERIVTIEDTAELQIPREHVVRLEVKPANAEGNGAYTIRDLVKNSLRMRPDRIVIGECRGGEAIDMLQAMNTGHDGSLTTIHANNPSDVQLRLEVMVQSAMEIPVASIHRQIVSAVDIIVQLNRFRDGSRRVTRVVEVSGIDDKRGGVRMKDLFVSHEEVDSNLTPTGFLPSFIEQLLTVGYDLDHFYC